MSTFAAASRASNVAVVWLPVWPRPYEISGRWRGRGESAAPNSDITVMPSGATSARYSPSLSILKFVCSSSPVLRRSFSEANIRRNCPGPSSVAGKAHLLRAVSSSVRKYPPRLMDRGPELKTSIQSENSPSLSLSPSVFSARNSVR